MFTAFEGKLKSRLTGVFDGHGGKACSTYLCKNMHQALDELIQKVRQSWLKRRSFRRFAERLWTAMQNDTLKAHSSGDGDSGPPLGA